jgi:anti-sigma factor RsiW
MKCAEIREVIPAHERDSEANFAVRKHLLTCADCRQEVARYKELRASLESMRAGAVQVPAELSQTLMAIPSNQNLVGTVRTHVARNRRAYVGGAAALAAGALGAAVWKVRSRRVVTA